MTDRERIYIEELKSKVAKYEEFLNEVLGNHKQFNPNKHFYMTERKTHWSFSPMGCKRLTLIENILTNSLW